MNYINFSNNSNASCNKCSNYYNKIAQNSPLENKYFIHNIINDVTVTHNVNTEEKLYIEFTK